MFACPDADASAVHGSSPMAAEMKASPQQLPEIKPDPAPPTDDAPPVTPVKVKQEPLEDDGAEERRAGVLSWRGLGAAVNSLSTPTNVSPSKTCNASSNSVQSVEASEEAENDPDGQGLPPPPDADPNLCNLCRRKARANKSKFCGMCRTDVTAAKRDCDKSGRGKWFARVVKESSTEFEDFMHEYIKANGASRRRYSQRSRFDFCRYEEARKTQNSLKLGFKAGVCWVLV